MTLSFCHKNFEARKGLVNVSVLPQNNICLFFSMGIYNIGKERLSHYTTITLKASSYVCGFVMNVSHCDCSAGTKNWLMWTFERMVRCQWARGEASAA